MIYTYWWWFNVDREREIEQHERMECVRSVQCDVSKETEKYSDYRHLEQPVVDKSCEVQAELVWLK
jgi:hypothetical protein